MRLICFEDAGVAHLEPLTLTRPAFALLCGACSLLNRHQRAFASDEVGLIVRPALADLCRLQFPGAAVNDPAASRAGNVVLVNARWMPPTPFVFEAERGHVGMVGRQVAYVLLPDGASTDLSYETLETWLGQVVETLPTAPAGGGMIDYPWDLIDANPDNLAHDLEWFANLPGKRTEGQGASINGPTHHLVVDASAEIEPNVVIDTRPGPVLIDRGAVVQAFTRIEGPCYIGPETRISSAKIRGGSFGAMCRLGGEIEASIVQGYSNKNHDGFLGHSYLGEWVNLAAGTQTSDLRNDYGKIKVAIAGHRVSSGKTKVGSFIGDHAKTALGTLLNTGSTVGAFCAILPSGALSPTAVPSFCQVNSGHLRERWDMRTLFTTADIVMRRRGQEWTEAHTDFYYWLYDQTAEQRRRLLRESEMRRNRQSG